MDERTPVAEIMTAEVVTTVPDARVEDAARLLREHHISGIPVVGRDGHVLGVLTETDLVRDLHLAAGIDSPRGLLDLLLESAPAKGESLLDVCRNRLRRARVRELMTQPAVTVEKTATVQEAARLLRVSGTNRLPVVDANDRLVGIVTRSDLVAALSGVPVRARGALHPSPGRTGSVRAERDPYADV